MLGIYYMCRSDGMSSKRLAELEIGMWLRVPTTVERLRSSLARVDVGTHSYHHR
jgi:hypothetical protein